MTMQLPFVPDDFLQAIAKARDSGNELGTDLAIALGDLSEAEEALTEFWGGQFQVLQALGPAQRMAHIEAAVIGAAQRLAIEKPVRVENGRFRKYVLEMSLYELIMDGA